MLQQIKDTADFILHKIQETPEFVIVLGSGLGKLQDEIHPIVSMPYSEIPNFPQTTVKGHTGKLIYGTMGSKKVLMMAGRFHFYEGYSMQEVTFPFRVFGMMGIPKLIVSNASGGVNSKFKVGDVMLIKDHINMFPEHPLRGKNIDELGPRFPDMSEAYSKRLLTIARDFCQQNAISIQEGVYVGLQGPSFETPSEYGMVKAIGGDAVGMSTVPEIIVARHMNLECFAISIITDLGGVDHFVSVSHEEVLEAANNAMPTVITIVKQVIEKG